MDLTLHLASSHAPNLTRWWPDVDSPGMHFWISTCVWGRGHLITSNLIRPKAQKLQLFTYTRIYGTWTTVPVHRWLLYNCARQHFNVHRWPYFHNCVLGHDKSHQTRLPGTRFRRTSLPKVHACLPRTSIPKIDAIPGNLFPQEKVKLWFLKANRDISYQRKRLPWTSLSATIRVNALLDTLSHI